MKINIHLHGKLGKKCGTDPKVFDVSNAKMMFQGLKSQVSGFTEAFSSLKKGVKIICLDENKNQVFDVNEKTMASRFNPLTKDVYIMPIVRGKGFDPATIAYVAEVLGSSLATASVVLVVATNLAVAVVLGAVSQILAPSVNTAGNGNESPDERASFIFNGPVNTVQQGGVIPLVYGQTLTGSVVISAGVTVEQITT